MEFFLSILTVLTQDQRDNLEKFIDSRVKKLNLGEIKIRELSLSVAEWVFVNTGKDLEADEAKISMFESLILKGGHTSVFNMARIITDKRI